MNNNNFHTWKEICIIIICYLVLLYLQRHRYLFISFHLWDIRNGNIREVCSCQCNNFYRKWIVKFISCSWNGKFPAYCWEKLLFFLRCNECLCAWELVHMKEETQKFKVPKTGWQFYSSCSLFESMNFSTDLENGNSWSDIFYILWNNFVVI